MDPSSSVSQELELTLIEQTIFSLLLETANSFTAPFTPPILRVAGGWVRDKILRVPSDDIDVVLPINSENIRYPTTDQFAEQLNKTLSVRYASNKLKLHSPGIVEINQDKGKNVRTVTLQCEFWINSKLEVRWLDFVNFRGQDPKQDAERRDLTINSLFFNIQTNLIEDFTQKGLSDISNQIIRTPFDHCLQTFRDDPGRILRLIRISFKLSFHIHPSITSQILSNLPETLSLLSKISRERIGNEIQSILSLPSSNQISSAFTQFSTFQIFDPIFLLPSLPSFLSLYTNHSLQSLSISFLSSSLFSLQKFSSGNHNQNHNQIFFSNENDSKLRISIASFYLAFVYTSSSCHSFQASAAHLQDLEKILRQGWKLKIKTIEEILTMIQYEPEAKQLLTSFKSFDHSNRELRRKTGLWLRKVKELWREVIRIKRGSKKEEQEAEEEAEIRAMERGIEEMKLEEVWKEKSVLSGKEVMERIDEGAESGKWVGVLMDKQVNWMLENGPECDRKECEKYLREQWEAMTEEEKWGPKGRVEKKKK